MGDLEVIRLAAFTTDPAGGNPAGVVPAAGGLDASQMLDLAARVGYSETAFVVVADDERRRYRLRYFSPRAEVAFCGHATVATAVALADRVGPGPLLFDTPAGEIPVATGLVDGLPTATLTSVPTRSRPATDEELGAALAALRWARSDLHAGYAPHVAFAGNDHLMLAAASRARLADLDYDFDGLAGVMRRFGWTTVHLFTPVGPDRFAARDPFPVGGVVEDPATGAAAAAFGGYLLATGHIQRITRLAVQQGEDLGRPSELRVDVDPADPRVQVTGHAVPIPAP